MANMQYQMQQQAELDPLSRFKILVPIMKKSLQTLMEVAASIFHQNSQVDACVKGADAPTERFDKCLEEFYAHCHQIELALKLTLECHGQNVESQKNTPTPVMLNPSVPPKTPGDGPQQEPQSYAQYLILVRSQINCAQQIHDSLLECSKKMSERMPSSLTPMQAPSSVGQVHSN